MFSLRSISIGYYLEITPVNTRKVVFFPILFKIRKKCPPRKIILKIGSGHVYPEKLPSSFDFFSTNIFEIKLKKLKVFFNFTVGLKFSLN